MTTKPSHEEIQALAHRLWEMAGRPEGRDDEFWERAELQLAEEAEDDATEENGL